MISNREIKTGDYKLAQIMESCYEWDIDLLLLLIDFSQPFDSLRRDFALYDAKVLR